MWLIHPKSYLCTTVNTFAVISSYVAEFAVRLHQAKWRQRSLHEKLPFWPEGDVIGHDLVGYPTWRRLSANLRIYVVQCYMVRKTWPMTSDALHRLCRNNRAMIRWICGVKPTDDPSMDDLHAKLGICDLAILVRERRLDIPPMISQSQISCNTPTFCMS